MGDAWVEWIGEERNKKMFYQKILLMLKWWEIKNKEGTKQSVPNRYGRHTFCNNRFVC